MLTSQEEQEERRRVALQDADLRRQQQQGGTFHAHAQAQADEMSQGRFAAIGSPRVVGSTPIPIYPQASTPFQSDPVPIEPPLGYSVAQVEPSMGTTRPTEDTGALAGAAAAAERLPPGSAQSDDAGAPSSPTEESK